MRLGHIILAISLDLRQAATRQQHHAIGSRVFFARFFGGHDFVVKRIVLGDDLGLRQDVLHL